MTEVRILAREQVVRFGIWPDPGGVVCGSHGGCSPAFDLLVKAGALTDVDAQAAVIVVTDVLAYGRGIVPLEGWAPELAWLSLGDVQPEALSGFGVGALVNVDTEDQMFSRDPSRLQETQEELDQGGITVDKADPVVTPVRLALRALAPVGDGSGDDDFPLGQLTDFAAAAVRAAIRAASRIGRSAAQYLRTPSAARLRHSS